MRSIVSIEHWHILKQYGQAKRDLAVIFVVCLLLPLVDGSTDLKIIQWGSEGLPTK